MNVRIIERGETRLAGLKVVGRRSELAHRAPLAWLELTRRLDELGSRPDPNLFYGVFREADHASTDPDATYVYWVATEVKDLNRLPAGFSALRLPAGRYAAATCRGGAEAIDPTYLAVGAFQQENGPETAEDALGFEIYDARRQSPTPPYDAFDFDVFRPLAVPISSRRSLK